MRILSVLAMTVALAAPAVSRAEAPAKAAKVVPVEAAFKVEGLSDAKLVRKLAKSLAGLEGVKASKADATAGRFTVSYEAAKTGPDAILARLKTAAPGATLDAPPPAQQAQPATPIFNPGHEGGCGGCPMQNQCGGHH
jgi:hypothetical protein